MSVTDEGRAHRSFNSREVVLAFARFGIPMDTMARALVLQSGQVRAICARALENGTIARMPPKAPEDIPGAMATELVHLREANSELRQQIKDLREANKPDLDNFTGILGLTNSEAKVVACIVKNRKVSKEKIYFDLYAGREDPPEPKIIDVMVFKTRRKLLEHDIKISTLWGWGYAMDAENIAKLRALVEGEAPPTAPTLESMQMSWPKTR